MQVIDVVGNENPDLGFVVKTRAAQQLRISSLRSANDIDGPHARVLYEGKLERFCARETVLDEAGEAHFGDASPAWIGSSGVREASGPAASGQLLAVGGRARSWCTRAPARGGRNKYLPGVTRRGRMAVFQLIHDHLADCCDLIGEGQIAAGSQEQVAVGVHAATEVEI